MADGHPVYAQRSAIVEISIASSLLRFFRARSHAVKKRRPRWSRNFDEAIFCPQESRFFFSVDYFATSSSRCFLPGARWGDVDRNVSWEWTVPVVCLAIKSANSTFAAALFPGVVCHHFWTSRLAERVNSLSLSLSLSLSMFRRVDSQRLALQRWS